MTEAKQPEKDLKALESGSCQREGKSWPQILAIVVASIGSLSYGLHYTWSSPSTSYILQEEEYFHITAEQASYFTVLPPIAMILSSLVFFKLTDTIGRKKTMLLIAAPQLIAWIIIIFARTVWAFYAARIIVGIGDAALYSSIPAYIGEVSTPKIRGLWGNSTAFSMYLGEFLINLIGCFFDVRTSAFICIGLPVLYFILLTQMPDSPYYLLKVGHADDAKAALKWLRRKEDIETEFHQMKEDVDRQLSETGTWKDLVAIKSNRSALIAGIFLRFTQQLGGIGVFLAYTQPIFEKAGGNISAQVSSTLFLGLLCVLNFIGGIVVEKVGRKTSYFYSALISGIILVTLSIYFFLDQYQIFDMSLWSWFPLAGMILYVFSHSFGLGVVPTLMLGELFSTSIKAKALCVMILSFGASVFLTNTIFHQLDARVGLYCPFLIFSVNCFCATILTPRLVPETKGKTLEEIQRNLRDAADKKSKAGQTH